jgi:ATP-dependent DNA helicase PIF1
LFYAILELPVIMGGDFRQVLPVIPGGSRADIVDAALNSYALWSSVKVLHLTENMCLKANGLTDDSRAELAEFSEWVRPVDNDTVQGIQSPLG